MIEMQDDFIVKNFSHLFNGKVTLNGNKKTTAIPVFNLPNIYLQKEFLRIYKAHKKELIALVPKNERQRFDDFIIYLKNTPMCVNCEKCSKTCYNNKAYWQYPAKAICDLRQLYILLYTPEKVIEEISVACRNLRYFRFNGSGEIHNKRVWRVYEKVARNNPDTLFYTYTKNFNLVLGDIDIPSNLVINYSWYGKKPPIQYGNWFITLKEKEYNKLPNEAIKCLGDCLGCKQCMANGKRKIYCKEH